MYGLIRILLYILLFFFIYKIVRFFSSLNQKQSTSSPQQKTSGQMVKDEVCNTYLPVEEAIKLKSGGKTHYFCSESCKKKYLDSLKVH